MPRTARASRGGIIYHVINRGNGRAAVFHKQADYQAFLDLMDEAWLRLPVPVLAYSLMPNHFHLVLHPPRDGELSRWMRWLSTAHVRRYHRHYHGSGHVWQGRFKAFPIQDDSHLLTVARYVERNPLRAGLVDKAEAWRWSSLRWWSAQPRPAWLQPGPLPRPASWLRLVNKPQGRKEEEAVRRSLERGRPFGSEAWTARIAKQLGLESSLNPRGRPRKEPSDAKK